MVTVETLSVLLGADETEKESLALLLGEAKEYLRLTCRLPAGEEVPDALLSRMVREDYARLTAEGTESRSISGVTERYLTDYSDAVQRGIRALRHPATVKREAK